MNFPAQFGGLDEAAALPAKPLHLAIGMFDGVHLGHRAVVGAAVQSARANGGIAAVLTFHPHPSALFNPGKPTRLIMDPSWKAGLLQGLGVDVVINQPFTPEFAGIDAGQFLPLLKKALPGLVEIYVGEDWRFGAKRRGDVAMLVNEARVLGVSVTSAPPVSLDGEPVSSTRIRTLLESGDVAGANALLGDPYRSLGTVVGGKGMGRTIGFPTLNLAWSPELRPRYGVYAVRVTGLHKPGGSGAPPAGGMPGMPGTGSAGIQGTGSGVPGTGSAGKLGTGSIGFLPGVANYGVRPTVETTAEPLLETHVLGPCALGCGDEITVEWLQFLRPEMKFPGVGELRAQIAKDVKQARAFFAMPVRP